MNSKNKIFVQLMFILLIVNISKTQDKLKPGFDQIEYRQLLEISSRQLDTPWTYVTLPFPERCKLDYRSDSLDSYYYPCGMPVVLMKQPGYEEVIANEPEIPLLFKNHMITPYYYLLNKIYFNK